MKMIALYGERTYDEVGHHQVINEDVIVSTLHLSAVNRHTENHQYGACGDDGHVQ